ncbi:MULTISPECIES: fumarylacetoacetate hydrolase family protein [unclassified Paenibacillus]|uniref:fumarylacetoacetate hydrolase family protein n=1 Tax=unclassified Paenibacillus TaxID=185978 RepID=UPI001C10E883|nr:MULTISPECIES: fumarylacetoacetate hydrolase family protein [unclassified Paenibacillus]MBU5442066.1 fumarylacetoacetate hydrolase family protein [Paenibacillus sp. MSJ-34]CAH0117617.1 putative protein YcgM [Paenibacillus sp. CECT 9249]
MEQIRNVYCVGRNYKLHAAELGNELPKQPMIFMKPTHAVVPLDQAEIVLPYDRGEVHYEAELVIRIARDYRPGAGADELIDGLALGIDFTLRDVQTELKRQGHPWMAAKGFMNSAPVTPFISFPGIDRLNETDFTLRLNGEEVQRGNARDMIFSVQTVIDYIAGHYGIGAGDLIFTGTPAGVGRVQAGDKFELYWGSERLGACMMK